MPLPADPFARVHAPTRAGRVAELLATAQDLAQDERPAFRRLGNAIRQYLHGTAPTLDTALGIATVRGSHNTPQALAAAIIGDDEGLIGASEILPLHTDEGRPNEPRHQPSSRAAR
jgi:hypothetical protein